ncbi:MAG: hypothetical protein IKN71_04260 [Alphaproteobacteria bacterium]|nr:hypothetical protein [Alphaproteobacteria bacterium]
MAKKILLLAVVLLIILKFCGVFKAKEPAPTNDSKLSLSIEQNENKSAEPATAKEKDKAKEQDKAPNEPESAVREAPAKADSAVYSDAVDMTKWKHNDQDGVYYQLNITYCKNPTDIKYQQLALFVPDKYLKCQKNGSDTFSCEANDKEAIGDILSSQAPYIIPIESPKYAPNPALTEYQSYKKYTDAGIIYAHVGFRGKEHGAPAGLVDLKAAIRYLRHNQELLPGQTAYIIAFGVAEGGGLSVLLGTSANSPMFRPYLQVIGAIDGGSDKIFGVMAWNPVTNLDSANLAYEWSAGMTRQKLSAEEKELSDKMAREYANYVNKTGFLDDSKHSLMLQYSDRGIYQEGTYYDLIKLVIGNAIVDYIEGTYFPHRVSEKETADFKGEINMAGYYMDKEKYLKAMNEKHNWIKYDFGARKADIRTLEDFSRSFRPATRKIAAFDAPDKSSAENILFGDGKGNGYHFDANMAKILKNSPQGKEYAADLKKQDSFGNSVQKRLNMYTPLYYIMSAYDGYRTAGITPYWRIRSGLNQNEISLAGDLNLVLALHQYPKVEEVDYQAVWNAGNTKAEVLAQDADEAFIKWMLKILHKPYWWNIKD